MLNSPKYIVLHTSDVSYKKISDQFVSINRYHRDVTQFPVSTLGYYTGYHVLVTGEKVYKCRLDSDEGAHCNQGYDGFTVYQPENKSTWPKGVLSMNFQSLSICFGGDGDIEYPTAMQYALMQKQVWDWQDKYKISNENVFFHRKFSPVKTCPGSLLNQEWLNKFLERPVPVVIPPKPVENMCVAQEKEIAKLKEQLAWYDKLLTWFFSKIA